MGEQKDVLLWILVLCHTGHLRLCYTNGAVAIAVEYWADMLWHPSVELESSA